MPAGPERPFFQVAFCPGGSQILEQRMAGRKLGFGGWALAIAATALCACSSVSLTPVRPVPAPSRPIEAAPAPAIAPAPAPASSVEAAPTPAPPAESAAVAARFPEPAVIYRTPAFEPGRAGFTTNAELRNLIRALVRAGDGSAASTAVRLLEGGSSQTGVPSAGCAGRERCRRAPGAADGSARWPAARR